MGLLFRVTNVRSMVAERLYCAEIAAAMDAQQGFRLVLLLSQAYCHGPSPACRCPGNAPVGRRHPHSPGAYELDVLFFSLIVRVGRSVNPSRQY